MRVLHVVPWFHPATAYGGPIQSTHGLCVAEARSRRLRCEVRVLTTDANGPHAVLDVDTTRELVLEERFSVRYCPRVGGEAASPALLRHLPGYLRWADVVHLMSVYSFPTIPTLLACNLMGRPVVWSPRGMLQRWEASSKVALKNAWDQVCRVVSRRGTTLHFTSQEEADESTRRFGGFPSVVIPNGVDLPERADHVEGPGLRLLTLGRLHPIKGIENLIAACGELRDRGFGPFSLTLAGEGDRAYTELLQRQVAKLSLGAIVTFAGDVRGEAKERLFAASDVLVAPSFRENFGNAIAEALAHQLPVIAGRGTPWAGLEIHDAGLWVKNDPASLAAAIVRVAMMPRAEMGTRGRAWVTRAFGWDEVSAQMIAVYEGLLRP